MITEIDNLDNAQGWVPLFHKLNWLAREKGGAIKAAKLPGNRTLNRYRDVLPYDHSRIVLKCKEGETDYINANLVEVPEVDRRYILSQGPLPHTAGHFWQMVWENNTKAVIMLNRVVEKNQVKCFQYWPCGESNDHVDTLEFDNFKITYISENRCDSFTVRNLELENIETDEKRDIYHFHYLTWPDFGVPKSPRVFLQFLFEARNAGTLSSDVGPAVIHCSAGIGRSGTYIMVDSILAEVEAKQDLRDIDLQSRLLDVRHYRIGLIQTPDQLRFTYIAILEGTLALMPDVYQVAFDEFIAQKEKALKDQRKEEEEGEGGEEEEEEPPPLPPRRKRPEEDEPGEPEDEIPEKRPCKDLPDIPDKQGETTETDGTPKVLDQSSDESGEDEIIDLSASLSESASEGEKTDEDADTELLIDATETREEPTETRAETTETQEEPTETCAESTETREELTETRAEPTDTREEPTETREEPTKTRDEPTETREEPTETCAEPTETREEPSETHAEPIEAREEPTETREEPTETREEPTETRDEPTETREEPTETRAEATETQEDVSESTIYKHEDESRPDSGIVEDETLEQTEEDALKSECLEQGPEGESSETSLRKRKWREKQEKTAELVNKIKSNVRKEEEYRSGYGPLLKKVLVFVAVCSVAYLAYRMFYYYFGGRAPPVKIRPKRKKF